ncbi:HhoA/HhoB/HtrA family serine endopeptidase [Floridanema aerugineum]|jgi:S1-C subfamily serine protease
MPMTKILSFLNRSIKYTLVTLLGVAISWSAMAVLPMAAIAQNHLETLYTTSLPALPNSSTTEVPQKSSIDSRQRNSSFVTAAVNRVGPAVVRIDTERTITRNVDPFFDDPFFRRFFGDEFSRGRGPQQGLMRGQGSGFIIDKNGVILTNAHVVDQADKVTVTLKDGRTFAGKVQGVDEVTDLAVVKIDAVGKFLPVAPLGDSSTVQVGDWAIAVGNPLGLDNTVTLGIVSTLKRPSVEVGVPDKRLDFIQTDAAINPGNSGGPLLNGSGEVIGINTAIRAGAMGIGFAIPIDKAKQISTQLAQGKTVAHPYIGIQMVTLTPQLAKENNNDPNSPLTVPEISGVLVMGILPNTPAAQSGLRRGDVIVEIDGQPVNNATVLQNIVEGSRIGQTLELTIQRGNQTQKLGIRTAQLQS